MSPRSSRLQEAFKRNPAPAGRLDPPLVRRTHTTEAAGAHRPFPHSGGPLRLLAARLIQEQLLRIGRAAHALEGDLASLLHRFVAGRGHHRLGYRRLADYLADRPGLSLDACRHLVQRDRARSRAEAGPAISLFPAPIGGVEPEERSAAEGANKDAAPRGSPGEFDVWMEVTRAVREALQPLGPGTGSEGPAIGDPPTPPRAAEGGQAPGLFDDPREGAADLDATLSDRVRRAQALSWRRAVLLGAAARHHLYRELGFRSLEDWCAATLGLAPCGARDLLFMNRMLALHPAIEDAFRRGRLSWSRAVPAARASLPGTERAWVREARRLPFERLRRAALAAGLSGRGGTSAG